MKWYADSSGRQVLVRTGRAIVRGVFYENTTTKTVAIAANSTGSTRLDRIVLKLDPTANTVTAVAKTGSTSPPALTQDDTGVWEMPLARVTVANGATGIAAGQVTDERVHTNTDVIPSRLATDITSPRFGTITSELSTGLLKWWNGTSWLIIPNYLDLSRTLGYAEITSNAPSHTSATPVDIPGLSTTVTVGAGQRIRIRADLQAVATAQGAILYIREGATVLNSRPFSTAAPFQVVGWAEAILTPSPGVHTYSAAASIPGGATFTAAASPTAPAFIHAEFLGVNS